MPFLARRIGFPLALTYFPIFLLERINKLVSNNLGLKDNVRVNERLRLKVR